MALCTPFSTFQIHCKNKVSYVAKNNVKVRILINILVGHVDDQFLELNILLSDSGCFQPDVRSWEGGPAVCRLSCVACGVAELSGFVQRN